MPKEIIRLENVEKYYTDQSGKIPIFNNLNFKINEGEFISILGKSGSGKTTFLNMIGLLDHPNSGKILFENNNLLDCNEKKMNFFRNEEIGFVFQFHYLLKEFSVLENVMLPGFLKLKKKTKALEKKAIDILKEIDLKNRIHSKVENLSGGEKQRVAIARALINEPKLILADEPTGNLDEDTSKKINQLFKYLAYERGQAILVVTHSQELSNLTQKKYIVKNYDLTIM